MHDIWRVQLVDMHLISRYNEGILFSCFTDIFSKFAWIISLKDKNP